MQRLQLFLVDRRDRLVSLVRQYRHRPTEAPKWLQDMWTEQHDWAERKFSRLTLTCCTKCGIVKSEDGKNGPCRGIVKVGLRDD